MRLIASIDSDIGKALNEQFLTSETTTICTSRRDGVSIPLELSHPLTWPKFTPDSIDELWYTIGIGDSRNTRIEVMQINAFLTCDFLNMVAVQGLNKNAKVVVLTSEWGSVSKLTEDPNARPVAAGYRMSKAALNMGVGLLSKRFQNINWILMQPGLVDTKMTKNLKGPSLSPAESADLMRKAVQQETRQFCFIDYLGRNVSF